MKSSSLGRTLEMVTQMYVAKQADAKRGWSAENSADLHAEASQAVTELAGGISAIGSLLAVHDDDKGLPADELKGLGWLLCGMGDLIDHLNEVRANQGSGLLYLRATDRVYGPDEMNDAPARDGTPQTT
jgi:hypothetical protein